MNENKQKKEHIDLLRRKAIELLECKAIETKKIHETANIFEIIYELQIHQIELEMQNDELIRARDQAELAELKYAELYDFAPSGYLTLSESGEIESLNFCAARMLGKERLYLLNRAFGFFVSEATRPVFAHFFQSLQINTTKKKCEVDLKISDGTHSNVLIEGIATEDGHHYLLNMMDITERKQLEYLQIQNNALLYAKEKAEIIAQNTLKGLKELEKSNQLLKESEEKLRISDYDFNRAQQIVHLGHWKWYLDTNDVVWSDEMYRIFGIDKNSYTGRLGDVISAVIHPDDLYKVMPANAHEFATNMPVEYRIIMPDKSIKHILAQTGEARLDETGQPIFINGIAQDISERKLMEIALKESEMRWKFALEGAKDGVWDWNLETNEVYFSPQWKLMLGFDDYEIGNNLDEWSKRVHPDDLTKCMEVIQNHIDGKTSYYSNIHRVLCKDETYKWILDRGTIIRRNASGKPMRMIGTHSDISDLKEMEKELLQLNVDKDRFISILAHDLKNPFFTLLGFSQLLVKNVRTYDIDKIERYAMHILNGTTQTYNLLNELLTWGRAHSGNLIAELGDYKFAELCGQVIEDFQTIIDNKEIAITLAIPAETLVYADKNLLKTVLRNLISNAIKFTHKTGNITLSVQRNDIENIIIVSDTGIGISPENISKLFNITQIRSTKGTNNEQGSGFGLLLCKDLVEKLGGRLWVESKVGKGSDFKFTLPFEQSLPKTL